MSDMIIVQKTQRLIIDPPTRTISIVSVGPNGPPGPQGPPGASTSLYEYNYSNTTTAPPSAGTFRFNSTIPNAVTTAWINNLDVASSNRKNLLMLAKSGAKLYVQDVNDSTAYGVWRLTADAVDSGNYVTLTVVWESGGTGLLSGNRCLVGVTVPGPAGPQGPAGPGFLFGTEANKPATPANPTRYFATDTKRDWMWDGTGWIIMDEPWANWVPTLTSITLGSTGYIIAQRRRRAGMCQTRFRANLLGTGVAVASGPRFTLPFPSDTANGALTMEMEGKTGVLYNSAGGRCLAIAYSSGDVCFLGYQSAALTMGVVDATNPFSWKANDWMSISFEYTMQTRYS